MSLSHLLKVPPLQRFCTRIKPPAHELWGTHPNHSHAQRKHAEQRLQDGPQDGSPLVLVPLSLVVCGPLITQSLPPTFGQKLVAGERLGEPGGHESSLFLKRGAEKLCL